MKCALLALGLSLAATTAWAQQPAGYHITLNLQQAANDRLKVVVNTPPVQENQVTYVMPSVIPGSYSKKDYGRFVSGFKAFDQNGKPLKVKNSGPNLFVIDGARQLARLEYSVDDTWDVKQDDSFIFQPGGTNFDAGRSFLLNHYGLYGYLEGYKMVPYEVQVTKPAELFGATALDVRRASATEDVFSAPSYVTLSDGPILYARPDTASFSTGGARVSVAVLSESGLVKAADVSQMLRPMSEALARFFGQMPVPRYQFLFYFPASGSPLSSKDGRYGAMEHSYSSVYFLPEISSPERLKSMVVEVSSHEFLHMLAPLNIHSREIGEFDFRSPQMSQHLWLYEGVTEYVAQLVQLQGGLISEDEFRQTMRGKIRDAQKYPEGVSFTEMSRHILEKPYDDMYENVYKKGALIGLLLDIRIQELSQGRQTLRDVLLALRQKYGPTRSFEDKDLIPEVVALTNPQLQDFFDRYVVGQQPLPLAEYLGKIGWDYVPRAAVKIRAFGQLGFKYDEAKKEFQTTEVQPETNAFGLRNNDAILAVNGQPLTMDNAEQLLRPLVGSENLPDAPVTLTVRRGATTGTVKGTPQEYQAEEANRLVNSATATPAQLALRRQVLAPKG